jgi:hypothetical protein
MRYNGVVENIFILHRCGALTSARLAWLDNVRDHAMRAAGWSAAEANAQDRVLTPEFEKRYAAGIAKDRCDLLARATDREMATTRLAP